MKYLFIFSCLIFNINIYAQNIQITHQNSKNHIDNFYINQVKNQATLYAFEDIEVSSKLIEKYLNEGFEVIIKTNKNIEISNSIYFNYSKKGALKFICEDTGTIQISDFAKIESKNAELNISLITLGHILIHPKSKIITNGGDVKLQAFEYTKRLKRDPRSSIEILGTIDASGLRGGKITVESDKIEAKNSARILSKGAFGGGKILIGGDWQGGTLANMKESEDIYEAIIVSIEKGALIDASATQKGNGGKIVVWSNINHPRSNTFVKGDFYAMGGKKSGKGGQIETSGGAIDFEKIKVSTIAADGTAGEWLIDPWNFYFTSSQLTTLASNLASNNISVSTGNSTITNANNPNTIYGTGHIVLQSDLTYTGAGARTLTLSSHEDIWINGNITSTGGALQLVFNAPSAKRVLIDGDITTNGGSFRINNNATVHFQKSSGTQTISTNGGAISMINSNIKLLRHNGTLVLNSNGGTFETWGVGTVDQIDTRFTISGPTQLFNGWGGAHVNSQKDYGVNIVAGREYSTRVYFWDSWDNERGELVVFENSTNQWRYYFTAHRTNGAGGNEMSNLVSNFGTQYQIYGPSHEGRSGWMDVYVDVTFVAQHNGILRTWNNLNQADSDESLEIFNVWETQFSTSTFTTGSRSLELISASGQILCGTKNFSGLANITFNTNNNDGFVDGIISGATNVTKSGTGRVRFSGKNTYTGTTTVSGGTYRFAPWFTGDVALSGAFTNNAIVTYESGNVNNRPTIYLDGGISGSGTWNISSDVAPADIWSNRLSFRSSTTTSGQINISSHGNLWFEGSNINTTSPIFLDGANARLRLYGPLNASMSTGAITGTGTVDFTDGGGGKNLTLAINTGSNNAQFDGIFSNSGTSFGPTVLNLRKDGTGTYTLAANNTYSGTTLVNGGVLQIGNGGATGRMGSGAVTVATNSTLNFNLNTATSFSNGFTYTTSGATIANVSTLGAMITLSGGINAGTNANTILDGGTAGITVSGAATPSGPGAGVWIKGDVTFTGSDLSGLVISSAGSGSTMRFKTIATPWWFGSTNATNAPNIVVDAGVTVSQNVSQAAGNLFYNNLSGLGTINIAGSAATHTILSESSVSNLNATSNIALIVGQGGASGSITSGNITANNGITLNSTSSYIYNGVLAGTTLTKQNTNTVTLTGTNTYSGTTTISGGILQLGNNGTSGSIGSGNIVNNGTLSINRSDNITLANAISGTGIVNKLNNTTATFTNNNTYTGATNITGTLVLQNNAPTSSSTLYQGTGALRIEPSSTSFTSTYSTTGWTFNNTLSGLTLGKLGNNSVITFANNTNIAGPILAYGGTVNLNGNITINSSASGSTIQLFSTNDIDINGTVNINSNNGNITIEADSDAEGNGNFYLSGMTVNSGSGDVTLRTRTFQESGATISTSGKIKIEPSVASFGNAPLSMNIFNLSSTASELTVGKPSNSSNITFGTATTISGGINVFGNSIAINDNLSSSNGGTISIYGNALSFGANKTLSSTGQLIIAPQTASNTIGVGGATGTLALPASYFSTNFSDGFSNIQIGRDSQTGNIATNAFTLRDNMTFLTSGSLTLGGKPVLGNNNVTLGAGITTINLGSPANYFQTNGSGTVRRSVANNTSLLFPVGNGTYNPISINNKTGTADVFSVNILDTAYLNGTSGGSIRNNFVNRTWNIDKNTASANAGSGVDLSFTWNANEVVGTLPNPTLNHHNGSGWEIPTMGTSSVSGTTLTYTGYKGTFSPFAIGGSSTIALPVELKEFVANCQNDYIQIDWTTASEIRNKAFELFKSDDAQDWKLIHTTEGQGTKATETHYQFNDLDKKESYYRLKDIDEDGVENWSQIIFAACKNDASEVQIYPNPASDFIKVVPQFENTTLKIINLEGKIIKIIPLISNQMMVSIKDLTTGVYIIEIENLKQKYMYQILKN